MAIGFHRIGYVSRATGRSAVQAYAYISATLAVDSRTNQIADYRNKAKDVACAGIMAPEGAPEWAKTPEVWDRLEVFIDDTIERRYKLPETVIHFKNTARVTQTHIFALPLELTLNDWEEISKELIAENFNARGLVAGYAIHSNDGNPHLHVIVSLHALNGDTFSDVKSRELYQNSFRKEVFSDFSDRFNVRLAERGFNARIDPRSYEERGLDLLPQVHEGWHARDLAEQGKMSNLVMENEQIRSKNVQSILHNTSLVLKELSQTYATFSEEQILKCVQKRMNDDPTLSAFVFDSVLNEAHHVGQDINGNNRYATAEYRVLEADALRASLHLVTQTHARSIPHEQIKKAIQLVNQSKGYDLSIEQENAVYTACHSKRMSLLVGRAGTGKTSSLQAIVKLHTSAGFDVIGMAISAEAASHLGHDAGIEAKTIASYELRWKKQDEQEAALAKNELSMWQRSEHLKKLNYLRKYDIKPNGLFIVDESGMIGVVSMQRILKKAIEVNAKVLFVGDDRQFKAIDAGDIFRKQVEIAQQNQGYSELTRIVRQKHDWMIEATQSLAEFKPAHALDCYHSKGHVHRETTEEAVIGRIAATYVEKVVHQNNPSGLVITFTNDACAKLNGEIRAALQTQHVVDSVNYDVNGVEYSQNDTIIFLKNCYSDALSIKPRTGSLLTALSGNSLRGVTNGTKGIIHSIMPIWDRKTGELVDHRFVIHLDKAGIAYEVSFDARDYPSFQHGYAITLYKSQGQTVNWAMVYATPHMDATAAYVAMSRHEQSLDIFYSGEDFPTYQSLGARLSRFHAKDLVVDYERDPENQLIFENVQSYVLVGREMVHALKGGDTTAYEAYGVERRILANEILANFSDHGAFILQQGLTKGHLEITAGIQGRTLSHLEERVLISLEHYIEAAISCRDLWHTIKTTHPGVYAKEHPRYADFKASQDERGSLAHNLITYAPIVRSFGKEIYAGTGYGFSTIQKQGSAFESHMLQNESLNRLSSNDQRDVALYKAMLLHQQYATQLYKEHQAKDAPLRSRTKSHGKALFKTLVTDAERTERLKMETCAGALSSLVRARMDHFESLAESLTLSLNHDRIADHAHRYERQQLIHVALGAEMPFAHEIAALRTQFGFNAPSPLHAARATTLVQMTASRELRAQIEGDESSNRKAVTKAVILNAVGREGLTHIYNQARHADRLAVNVAFGKETLNKEVFALITYSDACAKANQLWHQVRTEATQQGCAFNKTTSYSAFEHAAAMRDCLAYQMSTENTSSSHNALARLRQANALLMGESVGVNLTRFEKQIQSGFLHQACFTILDPHASKPAQDDAMDTLFTGLVLDDQRVHTSNILEQHTITKMYLVDKALDQIGDKMPAHKAALNTYQHALLGYKNTFRDFITAHGTNFKLLEKDNFEALNVRNAEKVRDEAAFNLRPLLNHNVPQDVMADLLSHLKVTQSQLLYQGDRFESLSWMQGLEAHTPKVRSTDSLENEHPHTHTSTNADLANMAYLLLERFALEGATKTPSSVGYALKTTGVTLNDLQKTVQMGTQPTLSAFAHETLFDYHQNVMAFGRAHQTLMTEFNEAKLKNDGLEKPKQLSISHMSSYSKFWQVRANLAQIAYTIQEQPDTFGGHEGLSHVFSERSRQKMSGYAHIHESMLLIQGYVAAKAKGDPLATNIACELTEILAFEAHEKKHNPSAPLAFGTIAALYHFEINIKELERDAEGTLPHTPLRAHDITYLLAEDTSLNARLETLKTSGPAAALDESNNDNSLSGTSNSVEAHSTTEGKPYEHTTEHINDTTKESGHHVQNLDTPPDSEKSLHVPNVSKKTSSPRPSFESVKAFTRDVKEQLIQDIEKVAVSLLGQPKRIEKNGIWHWGNGVRLHTHNGVVARGTFKNYSEGTDNIDVFGMIKQTQHFTRSHDAIQYGAQLCGMTLDGRDVEHPFAPALTNTVISMKIKSAEPIWKPIFPVPHELEHVDIAHRPSLAFMLHEVGKETMRFAYRDENERLLGYVVRLETEDGHKQTLPLTYCENGKGLATWKWKGFGDKTPLYGLDQLARNPHAPVLLVEGEKAADAAHKLLPNMVVLSWVGGSAGVKKVDLSPLFGKTVVMWPDNDVPGIKAADTLAERFTVISETAGIPHTFKVIDIPQEKLPPKWDLADPLPTAITLKDVKTHILGALEDIEKSLIPAKALSVEHEKTKQLSTDQHTEIAETYHAESEHSSHVENHGTPPHVDKVHNAQAAASKPITFDEINVYAEACGLEFVADAESMHFIIHVANKTINDINNWHEVLGKACDHDQLRTQAISTGVYAAWAKERDHQVKNKDKDKFLRKYITIGEIAGKHITDLTDKERLKTDEHSILFKAQATYESLEKQTHDFMKNPHELVQGCGAITQE